MLQPPWISVPDLDSHSLLHRQGRQPTELEMPYTKIRKTNSSARATKPATLTSGAVVNVPLFIKEKEWVKIDTSNGQYLERVNK